jgi:imidazolonepropionase-like amidohydrolase
VVLILNDRIAQVGSTAQIKIPDGARVIDLSKETVLPGLIDAHTHMFENPKPGLSRETSTLIAIHNAQLDLHAGFTAARDMSSHSNGYADVDVRDAINQGRIEGPRFQVSGRGIIWAATAPAATPMTAQRVHSVEEAITAVREHVEHGVDWIKLFSGGNYSFLPNGELNFLTTYPFPVLQALVQKTHRLGHKTACHVFGGEGLKNAIAAGCDTVEHGLTMSQEQADAMVAKGLSFDPTFTRYSVPSMDDDDDKNTGGKYRMIPLVTKTISMAVATKGLPIMIGSGADGGPYPHGAAQAIEFEALVKRAGMPAARAIQSGTMVNATVMGWQDRIGSIESGKYADIVAVSGDPLTDITELQRVSGEGRSRGTCAGPAAPRCRHPRTIVVALSLQPVLLGTANDQSHYRHCAVFLHGRYGDWSRNRRCELPDLASTSRTRSCITLVAAANTAAGSSCG